MATLDLRRVVGGLMASDAVLNRLLLNYADRLLRERPGHAAGPGPCFIVPTWDVDRRSSVSPAGQLFTVEAHTWRADPSPHENLDIILQLLHTVLTGDHARGSISAHFDGTAGNLVVSRLGTVYKVGSWRISLATSPDQTPTQPRLVAPRCRTAITADFLVVCQANE